MFKPLLIAILALAVVAAAVFVGGKYLGKEAVDETAGWKTYRDSQWGFEIQHPAEWNVRINNPDSAFGGGRDGRSVQLESTDIAELERNAGGFIIVTIVRFQEGIGEAIGEEVTFSSGLKAVKTIERTTENGTLEEWFNIIAGGNIYELSFQVHDPPGTPRSLRYSAVASFSEEEIVLKDKIIGLFKLSEN